MMQFRIGQGVDFHKLLENESRPLMIGGVEIPGILALEGHSDADVLLHSLSDAILGALGLPDIGTHFSDQDPANKNLDSSVILQKALAEMRSRGFEIENTDNTLIGEKPKFAPHREKIVHHLGQLLGISADRVGVKATTTEKMGALGRSEGLACISVVLLRKER